MLVIDLIIVLITIFNVSLIIGYEIGDIQFELADLIVDYRTLSGYTKNRGI